MQTVTLEHAREHLAELVAEARRGEEILISDGGKPVARLAPPPAALPEKPASLLGLLKGQVWMAPDFDEIPEGFEEYVK